MKQQYRIPEGTTFLNVLLLVCSLAATALTAQNTIGGTKALVPEEEVKRQSEFLDAERERMLGHFDKALPLYKQFLYDNPGNDAAWYGLSRTYVSLSDFANALEAIGKAVEKDPGNQWYAMYQANIYEKNGRLKDAIKVYEGLTKRFPRTSEFYQQLAYLCVLDSDPKGGLKALDKLQDLEGIREETSSKKHLIYVGLGDNAKAAAEYQKLADAFPGELKYRRRLGEFYERIGDEANARRVYEDVLRRNPNDPVAKIAGMQKTKSSSDAAYIASLKPLFADPKVAIDAKVKELLPYFPKLDAGNDPVLVQNLLELGALLEQAHPQDPKAWSLSGDLLYHANRPEEALNRYRQCIIFNPKVFSVWDNALAILQAQKNYPYMAKLAEQALDAFPNQPKAYYYYGIAATQNGKPDDALAQLEQAVLMTAGNPALALDIADAAGLALIRKKDYPAAVARYEQYLSKGGDKHPDFLEHYGDALSLAGQRDKALEQWKKAATIRKSPELDKKINN